MPKILLIITGGIAGYKSLYLIRLLKDSGYDVQPVMTKSAIEFITPLSVSTLSGNSVRTDLFDLDEESDIGHIKISRDVDMICVAPCTANFMAKIAHGIADDLASTIVLGSDKPLLLVPAMNPVMWENLATQDNITLLKKRKIHIMNPATGDTACGEIGVGRMIQPEQIVRGVQKIISSNATTTQGGDLKGKSFLVTVGGTIESIDPVRIITKPFLGQTRLCNCGEPCIKRGESICHYCGRISTYSVRGNC